ncbi:MAG: PDZ domain-containing protein [Candidatus Eisenbacteria bacterium]|uniref:PDZ domain-containing protein n=1 Tax=Eiseniibacteriota bacterium TaxID=2212470 RepID=A0A849SX45_UNCEI|nr:PDZ domain-containing protein [Candidatus Eisenbacteria bacterium]
MTRAPRVPHFLSHRFATVARLAMSCVLLFGTLAPSVTSAQGTLSALQTDVDQIARRARPSVVTVMAQRSVQRAGDAQARPRSRVGSGVAIDDHEIVTVASLVLGAQRVVVRTSNGIVAEAEVVGADAISNVALLRVADVRLPVIKFASHGGARTGDWVVSLGTSYRAQATQSVGNVAYVHREPGRTLLQLTNTVYPGNSGAAAIDVHGELVGIVEGEIGAPDLVADESPEERSGAGASFVLPPEVLRPVLESLRREGFVRHAFLGVTTRAVSVRSIARGGRRTPIGAVIERVVPGGPAERAGLRGGDIVVAFAGERVEYPEQLARWVASAAPGSSAEIVWAREEVGMNTAVELGEAPREAPAAWNASWLEDESPTRSPARIAELEREIRRLSGELDRLKIEPRR